MVRDNIPHATKVITFLFDTFLSNRGKISASAVYKKNLCEPNRFKEWRLMLVAKNWLIFEVSKCGKYSKYYPGAKLLKYINDEKQQQCELASTRDLDLLETHIRDNYVDNTEHQKLRNEHEALSKKVDRMDFAIDRIINIINPYSNAKKREDFLSGKYDAKILSIKKNRKTLKSV